MHDYQTRDTLQQNTETAIARLQPPPRMVPWRVRARLRFGGAAGYLWLLLFMCCIGMAVSFRDYDWYSDLLFRFGTVKTVTGVVMQVKKGTGHLTGRGASVPTKAYSYVFRPHGSTKRLSGTSYFIQGESGKHFQATGTAVTIDYLKNRPWISRIRGLEYRPQGSGPALIWFAMTILFGGCLLLLQCALTRSLALLQWGVLDEACYLSHQELGTTTENGRPENTYRFTYCFIGRDGHERRLTIDGVGGQYPVILPVLYHSIHSSNAQFVRKLSSRDAFTITDDGQIRSRGNAYLLALVLPLASLACIGWTIYLIVHHLYGVLHQLPW